MSFVKGFMFGATLGFVAGRTLIGIRRNNDGSKSLKISVDCKSPIIFSESNLNKQLAETQVILKEFEEFFDKNKNDDDEFIYV